LRIYSFSYVLLSLTAHAPNGFLETLRAKRVEQWRRGGGEEGGFPMSEAMAGEPGPGETDDAVEESRQNGTQRCPLLPASPYAPAPALRGEGCWPWEQHGSTRSSLRVSQERSSSGSPQEALEGTPAHQTGGERVPGG